MPTKLAIFHWKMLIAHRQCDLAPKRITNNSNYIVKLLVLIQGSQAADQCAKQHGVRPHLEFLVASVAGLAADRS
jgi:hypothetical protein